MVKPSQETVRARNRVVALVRYRPHDPALAEARRVLASERLADAIRSGLAAADPPLTMTQRRTLARLLTTDPDTERRSSNGMLGAYRAGARS